MIKKTLRDIDVQGKVVLVRLDWNVPIKDGEVTDAFRIEATKETLEYLWDKDCRIIITSHLGRPEGKIDPEFSLAPAARKGSEVLGRAVKFASDCIGEEVEKDVAALQPGEMLCLENVRFHPEEEANDMEFAKKLAALAEVYVYDAFASYRPHASTAGVAKFLPAVAGFLVEKEVDYITGAVEHPNRPLVAIIGGAKVSTKLDILTNLIPKVDAMLLTGPIANTFARFQGTNIGNSVFDDEAEADVANLLKIAAAANTQMLLPSEVMVSKRLEKAETLHQVKLGEVGGDDYIVDAAASYGDQLKTAIFDFLDFDGTSTVVWNGPLGITEVTEFRTGSRAMADAIIETKAVSIIGGGDTAGFLDEENLHDRFTWVSTGGGASLELMSGKGLPCVDALLDK
ncbi:MAG: phosphoglycerate kinase [Candidatus Saccharimonadales bacterium]